MKPFELHLYKDSIYNLLKGFDVSEGEFEMIFNYLKPMVLKKGEYFCKAGKRSDLLGILVSGLLMASFDTDEGKINISRFYYVPENRIVSNFESFKKKVNSNENIIALEDSILIYLTAGELETLCTHTRSVNIIARHFAEESYISALSRIHDLQVLDNKQRILKFLSLRNDLLNRISKVNIASYLRVNRNDLTKAYKEYYRQSD